MSKAKIYIGVGHGSGDSGAVNGKRRECDDNLRLALKVKEYFANQPVEVKFSRLSNSGLDINGRCNEANNWGADYFISLLQVLRGSVHIFIRKPTNTQRQKPK